MEALRAWYYVDSIPQVILGGLVSRIADQSDACKEEYKSEYAIDSDLFDIIGVITTIKEINTGHN